MHANKTIIAGAVAAAIFAIGSVQAAESVTTDEVKVTATRVEKDLSDVNMSVTVITAEDIKHSAARTAGELLQGLPGISIMNDGSQGMKRIKIRGENAFRTLVMIDGQRSSEHKSMSGTPLLIDTSMIERIEIIKGPASVLYGSDAIGGAINIITKKGGTMPLQGTVSAGYNTQGDGVSASGGIAGGATGWKYRLGVAYEDHGDLDTPAGKMENTDFNAKSANAFLSYDITSDATVGASFDVYDLEFHGADHMTPGFRVDVDEWKRSKTGLFAEVRNVTDSLQRLRADVFYQTNDKSMTNWIPAGMPGWYVMPQADNDLTQYGFSLQSDWQLSDSHYLIAGYEYNKDELDSVSPFGHKFGFNKPAGIMTIREYDGYQEMNAVYATMDTQLTDDFSVNYGVRYTWVDTQMKIEKMKGSPEPTTDRDSSDGKAVFNAGVMYTGIDNLTLRASYAQGYRHPILQELYIDSSMGGGNVKANPNLKPETSDNFELGARWNANGLNVDATLFYNMADNYIASREFWETIEIEGKPAQKLSGALMENVAKATTFGLELAASMDLQNGFEPYANITAMRRELEDINGWKTHDAGTPEFQARYGLRWAGETNSMNVRWDVYGITASDIKTTTRRKVTTKVPVTRHPGGGNKVDVWTGEYATRTIKHNGYTTFNMTAGIDFGAKRQYTIDAGIYNIFDEEYQLNGAIVEPGRHAAVKFNAVF